MLYTPRDSNPEPTDYETETDPTNWAVFSDFTGIWRVRQCQEMSGDVNLSGSTPDISPDTYKTYWNLSFLRLEKSKMNLTRFSVDLHQGPISLDQPA